MPNGYGAPYGGIASFQTNDLDSALNLIYQESKQRQDRIAQENALIDRQIRDEHGKIHSSDDIEFNQKWDDYRKARSTYLFDKNVQKDSVLRQQKRREADIALANVYRVGNASKERLAQDRELWKGYNDNPYDYADDFGTKYIQRNNTPTSKLSNVGMLDGNGNPVNYNLLDPSTYRDQGGNYDFSPAFKEARGQEKIAYQDIKPYGKEGLQEEVVPYFATNNPLEFRNQLGAKLSDRKAARTARSIANSYPSGYIQGLMEAYDKIPMAEWKRRGVTERPNLPTPRNEEEVFLNVEAMKDALASNSRQGERKLQDIKENIDNKNFNQQAALQKDRQNFEVGMEGTRQGNRIALLQKKKDMGLDGSGADDSEGLVDEYIANLKSNATQDLNEKLPSGEVKPMGKEIKQSLAEQKAFGKQIDDKVYAPDRLVLLPDGSYKRIFYKLVSDDKDPKVKVPAIKNGEPVIDHELSDVLTPSQVKVSLANHFFSGKLLRTEGRSKPKAGGGQQTTPKKSKKDDPLGIL